MNASVAVVHPLTEAGLRTRRLKMECLELLGRYRDSEENVRSDPRCKNPNCRWFNEDGSRGCTDPAALEFDHISGGGSALRASRLHGGDRTYYAIKKQPREWQILCANCHSIKSSKEKGGARLHKQPARVRGSQQMEGQPVRRVGEKSAEQSSLAAMRRQTKEELR
jgi:hypothetical protein